MDSKTHHPDNNRWQALSLTDLVDHIIGVHHVYLRGEFDRLMRLCDRIEAASPHARVIEPVAAILRRFASDIVRHLNHEEQVLFPLIRSLDYAARQQGCYAGGVDRWLSAMRHDHDATDGDLAELRRVTADFSVPDDAGQDYDELMRSLVELVRNMAAHTAKEDVLFARALEAEDRLRCGATSASCASSTARENTR